MNHEFVYTESRVGCGRFQTVRRKCLFLVCLHINKTRDKWIYMYTCNIKKCSNATVTQSC